MKKILGLKFVMTDKIWVYTRYYYNVIIKPDLKNEEEKREGNSSSESQLIHQFTVVDYLLTGSTFPLSLPKQCCKRRNPIN